VRYEVCGRRRAHATGDGGLMHRRNPSPRAAVAAHQLIGIAPPPFQAIS